MLDLGEGWTVKNDKHYKHNKILYYKDTPTFSVSFICKDAKYFSVLYALDGTLIPQEIIDKVRFLYGN